MLFPVSDLFIQHLTWEGLLKDELVSEEEGEGGREGLRPDVEPQEADGEADRALPRTEPGKQKRYTQYGEYGIGLLIPGSFLTTG